MCSSYPHSFNHLEQLHHQEIEDPIVIGCAANESYAMPLAVMLYSLLSNAKKGSAFYIVVIGNNLSVSAMDRLRRSTTVTDVSVNLNFVDAHANLMSSLSHLPTYVGYITSESFLRLFLPSIVPSRFDKVIYLDCDLFINADINELWNTEIKDYALMACVDPGVPMLSLANGLKNFLSLGYSGKQPYFNSGVLILNLKKWRQANFASAVFAFADLHKDTIQYADQDALNGVLANDWGALDLKWNVIPNCIRYYRDWPDSPLKDEVSLRFEELMRNPSICHFATQFKPWQPGYIPPHMTTWLKKLWHCGWFSASERYNWFATWLIQHACILISRKILRTRR